MTSGSAVTRDSQAVPVNGSGTAAAAACRDHHGRQRPLGEQAAACRASAGHRAGAEAVRKTFRAAVEAGVEVLTLYAFSSENWRRSDEEVTDLKGLLLYYRRARAR